MSDQPVYESIGQDYASSRQPEPRWAEAIERAIGDAQTILNVGAGAGSYEPADRLVMAVEPSPTMIAQRPATAAPVVRAFAEDLPFDDHSFDVAMAILTTHHWLDAERGLKEMKRVAARQIVLTWDPDQVAEFWLIKDYLPEIAEREKGLPTMDAALAVLDDAVVIPLPVPHNCQDGALGAFWRRPEGYLDPTIRGAMSGIALTEPSLVEVAMVRLAADLASGAWAQRNTDILDAEELDLGYRLLATPPA